MSPLMKVFQAGQHCLGRLIFIRIFSGQDGLGRLYFFIAFWLAQHSFQFWAGVVVLEGWSFVPSDHLQLTPVGMIAYRVLKSSLFKALSIFEQVVILKRASVCDAGDPNSNTLAEAGCAVAGCPSFCQPYSLTMPDCMRFSEIPNHLVDFSFLFCWSLGVKYVQTPGLSISSADENADGNQSMCSLHFLHHL